MTIGTLDLLVEILATYHLKTVAIDEFIGIKKSSLVEVESVNVECCALCLIAYVCIIKKPSSDGHVHSRKNGGA